MIGTRDIIDVDRARGDVAAGSEIKNDKEFDN